MYKIPSKEEQQRVYAYMQKVPYDVMPERLYSAEMLYDQMGLGGTGRYEDCFDKKVYDHYIACGKHAKTEEEMLARALHDYAIGKHLDKYLANYDQRRVVGVMGGHALLRTDPERVQPLLQEVADAGLYEGVVYVLTDREATRAHYQAYEGPVEDVGTAVNDTYLKSFGESEGVRSYGLVVDYLIAWNEQSQ